jgi:leucyl-tRNA synthetase
VDTYIGGAEHAVLHLLYARFFTKFFYDQGYVQCNEPFQRLYNQGTILGPDGQKMSKSKGNVINPDELVEHYGADTVRVYLAFLGPYDQGGAWNPAGIEGTARFVRKVYTLMTDRIAIEPDQAIEIALNKLIKKITHDIPKFKFNTSIAACMEFINKVGQKALTRDQKERLLKILAPFCPFLTEEIWHTTLNNKDSIHTQQWPKWDETLLVESIIEIPIQINGKLRDCIKISAGATEEEVYEKAIQSEKIKKFITNENNVQKIFIPDKLLNIVTVQ